MFTLNFWFESLLGPQKEGWHGRYINVRPCGGLSMVFMQLKDPLELFLKRREFLTRPVPGFLSRRDMTYAVESHVKPHSFVPCWFKFWCYYATNWSLNLTDRLSYHWLRYHSQCQNGSCSIKKRQYTRRAWCLLWYVWISNNGMYTFADFPNFCEESDLLYALKTFCFCVLKILVD